MSGWRALRMASNLWPRKRKLDRIARYDQGVVAVGSGRGLCHNVNGSSAPDLGRYDPHFCFSKAVIETAVQLTKIRIRNFRSLKNLEVDLDEYLSIIVGKNNSGETSLLLALERILNGGHSARFEPDDFNIIPEGACRRRDATRRTLPQVRIALRLFIEYGPNDDLANVGNKVIIDLNPDNHWIVLDLVYLLAQENLVALNRDWHAVISSGDQILAFPRASSMIHQSGCKLTQCTMIRRDLCRNFVSAF